MNDELVEQGRTLGEALAAFVHARIEALTARNKVMEEALREIKRDTAGSLCVTCQNMNDTAAQTLGGEHERHV